MNALCLINCTTVLLVGQINLMSMNTTNCKSVRDS